MKENKVPTLSIVHDMPNKKPAKKDELDTVFGRTPNSSQHKYQLLSTNSSQKIELKDFPFTIGRALTSDLVIMDKNVSRNHAIIQMEDGHVVIENKGSLNGVRVNNRKVERAALLNGDEIQIASAHYTLQIERLSSSFPVERDDSQNNTDTYSGKAASNDDQLNARDQTGEAGHLLSRIDSKMLYAFISITAIVMIAIVVTLFQSAPDLGVDIDSVLEKDIVVASSTDDTIADNSPDTEITDTMPPLGHEDNGSLSASRESELDTRAPQESTEGISTFPSDNMSSQQSGFEKEASTQVEPQITTQKPEPEIIATPPVVSKPDIEVIPPKTVTAEREIKVIPKKAVTKPARYSTRTSNIKLGNAKALYLGGNYHASNRELKSIQNSSRHRQQYRNQARKTREQFSSLYTLYSRGKTEYARKNKPKAFKTWTAFLKKERSILKGRSSLYTRNVKKTVALEYEEKGRQAYMRDDWRSAFRYWKSSLKMRPNPSITNVMQKMDAEIASLYAKGSQLEKSNKPEAIKYWTEVVNKAPDNQKYYIKAKAKLRWLNSN